MNSSFFYDLESGTDEVQYYSKVSRQDAYKEYLMGRMYLKGEGIEQDYFKSYQTFLLAAENGYHHANYYIGNQYYYGLGLKQDFKKAFEFYERACESNDSYAEYRIAKMHLKGEGVAVNVNKAEEHFIKCLKRVTVANYDLAQLYENHRDIFSKSNETIQKLYKTALEEMLKQENDVHDVYTEMRIAGMYLNGNGAEKNISEAVC